MKICGYSYRNIRNNAILCSYAEIHIQFHITMQKSEYFCKILHPHVRIFSAEICIQIGIHISKCEHPHYLSTRILKLT